MKDIFIKAIPIIVGIFIGRIWSYVEEYGFWNRTSGK